MSQTLSLDAKEQIEAQDLENRIPPDQVVRFEINLGNGISPLHLSPELSDDLLSILMTLAKGGRVTISSTPKVLSSTEAARHLGISRPTLMKLVREGKISSFKVGSHTRFDIEAVANFVETRKAEMSAAFNELRELDL